MQKYIIRTLNIVTPDTVIKHEDWVETCCSLSASLFAEHDVDEIKFEIVDHNCPDEAGCRFIVERSAPEVAIRVWS